VHGSVLPGFGDLAGLLLFLVHDPYLFISSSTVMTATLVGGLAVLTLVSWRVPALRRALSRSGASLALVFAYFGLGSLALSTEILIRFHDAIPLETETQFISGLGHLAVGATGAFIAWRLAAGRQARWLLANAVALLYWALQLVILDPPWFAFQGQEGLVRTAAFALIATLAFGTAALAWLTQGRREPPSA
jgi:hypothetical protein